MERAAATGVLAANDILASEGVAPESMLSGAAARPAGTVGCIVNVEIFAADRAHVWHPYASMVDPLPVQPVVRARGVRLTLADGRELIDGMSSWWAAIHGYANPVLDRALQRQLDAMAHVMLGGLTHEPVVRLAQLLVDITPEPLTKVFFCDSGSVAVEVALKMAVQHERARGFPRRTRFLTIRSGYHGDTSGAMSVCDPVTDAPRVLGDAASAAVRARPPAGYDAPVSETWIEQFERLLVNHRDEIAGVVVEPVVQGAGGMRFYAPGYLGCLRELCSAYNVLLIVDEIATGFGRTGRLFGCQPRRRGARHSVSWQGDDRWVRLHGSNVVHVVGGGRDLPR